MQANKATYACFFDAAKAYDSVPHTLLLHRLLQHCVVGPVFAILVAMHSSAFSRVRVGTALSPAFVVQLCGVAEGCPLSPLLYAIFIDPVLQDMQSLSHPDMLWVGPATSKRKLVSQAYADDLAGIAATQQGLQRVVDAVHTHGLHWGWLLNVPKSVVMVFGKRSGCARLDAPELWWGACRLPAVDAVKYLGLRLESDGGWAAQQAAGAANGWAALHQWLSVLRGRYLSATTKLLVLRSRIAPCRTYGMELWRPAKNGANMTAVLARAEKLISGIHREASHTAFCKDRSVNHDVMLAELDILSAADHCRMAHARQYARQAASAAAAAIYVHNDPCSPEFRIELSAAYAPDYMGATVWQGLHARDTWCVYARSCHETTLSHGVRSTSTPTRAAPDMVGEVAKTTRKDIGIEISASALVAAGACGSRHMGCMGGAAHKLAMHTSGGVQTSVNPHRVNTFGTQRSDRLILLHHRRPRLYTQLCPCVRHTWSGIIVLTLGSQLSPRRVVSATITCSPHVRIVVLLLGLKQLGSTDGATFFLLRKVSGSIPRAPLGFEHNCT